MSKVRWAAAALSMVIWLAIAIATSFVYFDPSNVFTVKPVSKQGIAIDAGSSHTSLILYEWPTDGAWHKPAELREVTQCYIDDGGLAQFGYHPEGVAPYLGACLANISAQLIDEKGMHSFSNHGCNCNTCFRF